LKQKDVQRIRVTSAGSHNLVAHNALQSAVGEYVYFKWPPCSTGTFAFRSLSNPVTKTLIFAEGRDGLAVVFDVDSKNFIFQTKEQNKHNLGSLSSGENFVQLQWEDISGHAPAAAVSQPSFSRLAADPRLAVADSRRPAAEPPGAVAVADPRRPEVEPPGAVAVAGTSSTQMDSESDSGNSCVDSYDSKVSTEDELSSNLSNSESSDSESSDSDLSDSESSDSASSGDQIEEDRADEQRGGAKRLEVSGASPDDQRGGAKRLKVSGPSPDDKGGDPFASVQPPEKAELYRILSVSDLYTMTKQVARRELERKMGLSQDALFHRRKELNAWIDEYAENEDKLNPQASPESP
jgi:hypothetical protein